MACTDTDRMATETDSADGNAVGTTTNFEKIELALKTCAIDEETAVKYRVFAAFKDARLPAEFRGDDSGVIDSDAIGRVYDRWSVLSGATREILEPFLVPPAYRGSWASRPKDLLLVRF